MAIHILTESPDENWHEGPKDSYHHRSILGAPVTEDEVHRRRDAGRPVVLWRWDKEEATLVERPNV